MQTILLGQPQFRATLANPDLEQLRQRILASYHLGPLSDAETRAYVEHRLKRVGWSDDPRWEDAAFTYIYRYTGGIPRRINTLCSRVLLYGAIEETHTITGPMVGDDGERAEPRSWCGPCGAATYGGDGGADRLRRWLPLGHPMMRWCGASRRWKQMTAKQDRVFRRLMDLLSAVADR